MEKAYITSILFFSFLFANAVNNPDNIIGVWLMANKNVKVHVYRSGQKYMGKVIWMDTDANYKNFSVGAVIIDNMIYNSANKSYEEGFFYGRGYRLDCELELIAPDSLQVDVYKGFIQQTRYCTRVD